MIATEDNIFVKCIEEKEGALHIPPVFRRKNQIVMRGVTVNVGPEAIVGVGETIIFNKWQDNMIVINNETLLLIKPYHILAIQ